MLGAKMNDYLDFVHGHTMDDLFSLLKSEWRTDAKDLHLGSRRLGGMSNLNILIHSAASDYILKLPGLTTVFETNPFQVEFNIALHLAENGLGPIPLCLGRLQDERGIPFMICSYEPGVVHASLSDISLRELGLAKTCLDRLAAQHIPEVPSYPSARHYAIKITNKMMKFSNEFPISFKLWFSPIFLFEKFLYPLSFFWILLSNEVCYNFPSYTFQSWFMFPVFLGTLFYKAI